MGRNSVAGRLITHQSVRGGLGLRRIPVERLLVVVVTMLGAPRAARRRTEDIDTARTERSVAIEEAFRIRKECRSSLLVSAAIVIAITSERIVVVVVVIMIVSIVSTIGVLIVSEIDAGRCRDVVGDGGGSRVMITIFTVGSQAAPIARGLASAGKRADIIVVYLVSY